MKKYARIVQCDERGQIVIPKEVRTALRVEEGTGFYVYTIEDEGFLLKIIPRKDLADHDKMVEEVKKNAQKLNIKKENIDKSLKKTARGNFQDI
ncbi:AbrB/MazE/SpoVT family DNA-binding domain-containing protein [Candidatus Woesearchaeota archaeon]|nr:MAG: AbrB/MazE/SpoVT family DNA-binding domain-containing protein [Candidatus Woesearchaeota archaeon]